MLDSDPMLKEKGGLVLSERLSKLVGKQMVEKFRKYFSQVDIPGDKIAQLPRLVIGEIPANQRGIFDNHPGMPLVETVTTAVAIYVSNHDELPPEEYFLSSTSLPEWMRSNWVNIFHGISSENMSQHENMQLLYEALIYSNWSKVSPRFHGRGSFADYENATFSSVGWNPGKRTFGAALSTADNAIYLSPSYIVRSKLVNPVLLAGFGFFVPDAKDEAKSWSAYDKSTLTHEYLHAISKLPL